MNKSVKIILALIISIFILFGLIKWIILPLTIQFKVQKSFENAIENSNLNSMDIEAFNAQFIPYEGTINGSKVKFLIQTVSSNNSTNDRKISINFNGTTYSNNDVLSISNLINSSNSYNVSMHYSSGYIDSISIN